METSKITIILLSMLLLLPGCGKKKSTALKPDELETNLDILSSDATRKSFETMGMSGVLEFNADHGQPTEVKTTLASKDAPEAVAIQFDQDEEIPFNSAQEASLALEAQEQEKDRNESIEFYFENTDLDVLVKQIAQLFDITFISEDALNPLPQGAKLVKGNKLSFKTNRPFSKKEAWNLFVTFMELAGFAIVEQADPKIMRITTLETARKSPLPTFIGVPYETLPENDQLIRYVYFIENMTADTAKSLIDSLKSSTSVATILTELKAIVITDKSYNIKSLMTIIKELDRVTMPQAMSVLKLRRADVMEVKKLYDSLIGGDDKNPSRLFPQKKSPTAAYFPENTRIIPEPRTNSLILLGPADAIAKIEQFITQHVDINLSQPYSPLHVLQLQYADSVTVSNIMSEVTQFGKTTEAGKSGGVRGGDKYMKPITFTPEPSTNRIVIKADYDDFLKAQEIIKKLDTPQPQVGIEVLLLAISLRDIKELGAALRTREPCMEGFFGDNVKFQTSGLYKNSVAQGIVTNPEGRGVNRLLGDLLDLVVGAGPGNTIISLGDGLSTWGIIQALQSISNTQVLSNPYVVATNKTEAVVSLGEVRRVITGTVIGTQNTNVEGDAPAELVVKITPQINSDGMIILDIDISLSNFISAPDPNIVARTERKIQTKTIVADKEVLALGGLIQNTVQTDQSGVPILSEIPVIGWLFKNRHKEENKENLLVLISSRLIKPTAKGALSEFTQHHLDEYKDTLELMEYASDQRDPIHRWFFQSKVDSSIESIDSFIYKNQSDTYGVKAASALPYAKPIVETGCLSSCAPVKDGQRNILRTAQRTKSKSPSLVNMVNGEAS